jgi:NAD(P)H-nitrite reductase large subunit
MKLDKVICPCKKVKRIDVLQAIADGAVTLGQIEKKTGAMSKCGKCKRDIKKLMKKLEDL